MHGMSDNFLCDYPCSVTECQALTLTRSRCMYCFHFHFSLGVIAWLADKYISSVQTARAKLPSSDPAFKTNLWVGFISDVCIKCYLY